MKYNKIPASSIMLFHLGDTSSAKSLHLQIFLYLLYFWLKITDNGF